MENYARIDSVANRLREAMYKAEKSQADLSRETGISKATLSRYLSGQFEPKQIAVNKMAVALNVAEMWLWGCDVPMERPVEQKKSDELVQLIHSMRTDEDLKNLFLSICSLTGEQRKTIKSLVNELSKVNSLH